MRDIPQYDSFTKIEQVDKGWSGETKYYIETSAGQKLLLRLSEADSYQRKKTEFEYIGKLSKLGGLMSMPVDFGVCNEGKQVFMLLTWVEGRGAEYLTEFPVQLQYKLGLEAGEFLKRIHSIPARSGLEPWADRYNRKITRSIENYNNCGIRFTDDDRVVQFIEQNRHMLSGRQQTLQHGDYHVGNMIISPDTRIGIIDFNRMSFGDPWEEYDRLVWSIHVSKAFAQGTIDGYFKGIVPEDFFRLVQLYIVVTAIASIPWSLTYGEEELRTALRNVDEMLNYYQGLKTWIPTWYKDGGWM